MRLLFQDSLTISSALDRPSLRIYEQETASLWPSVHHPVLSVFHRIRPCPSLCSAPAAALHPCVGLFRSVRFKRKQAGLLGRCSSSLVADGQRRTSSTPTPSSSSGWIWVWSTSVPRSQGCPKTHRDASMFKSECLPGFFDMFSLIVWIAESFMTAETLIGSIKTRPRYKSCLLVLGHY